MEHSVQKLVTWPISENPLLNKEFPHRLQTCCSSWRHKTNSSYNSQFSLVGVSKRTEILLLELLQSFLKSRAIKWIAEFIPFSYVISKVHQRVYGQSI